MLIAHLSDPHVRPRGQLYQGVVDSNAMFEAALAQLDALDPRPDLVLLTGDVVDEGTAEEYAVASQMLADIGLPLLVIPGNHDEREAFRACFKAHAHLPATGPLHFAVGEHGPVRIVALDVTPPGEHHGEFDDATAFWLEATLAAEPERPTLVMMHQPPFASGIPYIDDYSCRGGERLAAIIARHPQVERVLCGHIHRFMQLRFGGTMLLTAPSTTTAIALRLAPDAEPASYVEPPAMLLHQWRPGTGLVTHFVPIGRFAGPFDFF
ncbi:3',5'-cyclic AMP phosphodiesterase CpdA [Angulomicrobium tetraedrale]|uniref:3',5'-cyclic AMP phosphodiesterase CpdA n=1 Tax=Ancylobacter tetraedralis TaxID=217068 RepID=A0A839ZAY8_9HYPH|nr:phosphodiesterase [Ancylobacter tetraedralis]MBB3771899.1 3',5'-cyclic AMP phosphodiesterase CpdA [Ancylobacter tetraedralis]